MYSGKEINDLSLITLDIHCFGMPETLNR